VRTEDRAKDEMRKGIRFLNFQSSILTYSNHMKLEDFQIELKQLHGAMPVWQGRVNPQQWRSPASQVRDKGGRLVALWSADNSDRNRDTSLHRGADRAVGIAGDHAPA